MFNFKCKSLLSNFWRLFAFSNFQYKLLTYLLLVTQAGTVLQCSVPSNSVLVCIICSKCFLPSELGPVPSCPLPNGPLYGGVSSHPFVCALCLWPSGQYTPRLNKSYLIPVLLLLSREWPVPDGGLLVQHGPPNEGTDGAKNEPSGARNEKYTFSVLSHWGVISKTRESWLM